ncbi:MAG: M28 family peptidase [Polyangiaceae bacterium]|nr:M28 family peptidase [Polyangiaceae bacterium]
MVASLASCRGAEHPTDQTTSTATTTAKPPPKNPEPHLADIRQLTFGGENAEAYWSFKGDQLILQSRTGDMGCDRIYRMPVNVDKPTLTPVSSGKGATTCSYFMPGDEDVIYASTHLGGDACPPKPDHSKGYVWALYDTYDIFKAKADGSNPVRLTETPGYDAEATVCKKDGSIIFTSVRDKDIELYRMDADGKNVKRLTTEPGYDGGAFFNEDCSKIVWRASRPKGKALEDFKSLLSQNLVRPTKLELWVANADGSDATQVTYLDSASFAPFFAPGSKRILFSSNVGDPKGREFDIWAIDVDGSNLERVTATPGFDGFPMFSPDGKQLAFASNRATEQGKSDTNVFVARWVDTPGDAAAKSPSEETGADRVAKDARWLADPAREGRGVGTKGLEEAGAYVESRFKSLGLEPAAAKGSYRQTFPVRVALSGDAKLDAGGKAVEGVLPLSFSSSASKLTGELVLAGYGIQAGAIDDYKGLDVKDKIVVVRRFVPDGPPFDKPAERRRHGDLERKARLAREKGAKAIIIVDYPTAPKAKMPDEAKLPTLGTETSSDARIVALAAPRAALAPIVDRLAKREKITATIDVALKPEEKPAFNVVAKLPARGAAKKKGAIVIGAHYDHLGMGGHGSLAHDGEPAVHPGADDNASGVAALLEIARGLSQPDVKLDRDVYVVAFSGEERGILGSSFLTKNPPPGLAPAEISVMINLDMVGRVRNNKMEIVGHDTAKELGEIVEAACATSKLGCAPGKGGGFGPSDHAAFYGAGVPVLFLFSGTHGDYHKPSDTADKLNAGGIAQSAVLVEDLARRVAARDGAFTYVTVSEPPVKGDQRSFGASLGTIPDYVGSADGKGVLLAGVRQGGGADQAGLKRGDRIVKLGTFEVSSVEDLMFVLNEVKPGTKVKAVIMREGKKLELPVTFQASKR